MKEHKGMRSHDIVILLKIISLSNQKWLNKDLAYQLHISASEVSESLNRSRIAKLINADKRIVNATTLKEFLVKGLPYAFPSEPGRMTIGVPTAHTAPPLNEEIFSNEGYVWPHAAGKFRGEAITPLHPKVPEAVENDLLLYELLALVDAIRVGRAREKKLATELLNKKIDAYQHPN